MEQVVKLGLIKAQEELNANNALNVVQTREQSMMLGCSLGAVNQANESYFITLQVQNYDLSKNL